MNERVNVLVSTYNGEKYLQEQLDSVLNQTYSNIYIYIRDDGSTDGTKQILEKYKKLSNVYVLYEENVGYGTSFLKLLNIADCGDYWAFCDQDDVWLPDKITVAVEWLKRQDIKTPCLYHGAYYNTDEFLGNRELVAAPQYQYDFVRAITECLHLGFSQVMNRALRELVIQGNPNSLVSHDWWTELIVMKFGQAYYADEAMTLHRRLKDSISVNSMDARIKWFKKAWSGNAEIRTCTSEFDRVFGQYINDRESKIVRWFCGEKYDILKSLKKAFYWRRWRPTWSSEMSLRILMLFGKI